MVNERLPYAGPPPWYGLGKQVGDARTSIEAISKAGLGGWNVHTEPFTTESGGRSGSWRAIVRGTDKRVLGTATEVYKPIQNETAFEFLDSLVADRVLEYDNAGSLMGGRKVWVTARFDPMIRIGSDDYVEYMLLLMGHDNYTSLRIYNIKERVVCGNAIMRIAARTPSSVRIVHSGDISKKFDAARDLLKVAKTDQARITDWLERLAWKNVSEDDVDGVRTQLFGTLDDLTPSRRLDAVARFNEILEVEKLREGRTAYALIQTVTGYADHMLNLRVRLDGEERMHSALWGSGASFKRKGFKAVGTVSGIPLPV